MYDIVIIGGGINGLAIARDAAGRGLKVYLCEQSDLGSATSSASSKLIHGGLRYLEQYHLRLVRESLKERSVLLESAPHIIWPMAFTLPHAKHIRPFWLIRTGVHIYDFLSPRTEYLPRSRTVHLDPSTIQKPYHKGIQYYDCWVDDARLCYYLAKRAEELNATIHSYQECTKLHFNAQKTCWELQTRAVQSPKTETIQGKLLINATGAWVHDFAQNIDGFENNYKLRFVQGSHLVVRSRLKLPSSYIVQNEDGRIVFAIPYENDTTLIGTTDVAIQHPDQSSVTQEEVTYLCDLFNRVFHDSITSDDVIHSYVGVRPLFDDGSDDPSKVTRDYCIDFSTKPGPVLTIYGGKITTHRALAEDALSKIQHLFPDETGPWTHKDKLPGGDFPVRDRQKILDSYYQKYENVPQQVITGIFNRHGTQSDQILTKDMGIIYQNLYSEAEFDYCWQSEKVHEWSDVLYRRTKAGFFLKDHEKETLIKSMV